MSATKKRQLATISATRQLTLPTRILAQRRLHAGDKFLIDPADDTRVLRPIGPSLIPIVAGCLASSIPPDKRGKRWAAIMTTTQTLVAAKLAKEGVL